MTVLKTDTPKKNDSLTLKICIGGKGGVGKTSFCKNAVNEIPNGDLIDYKLTIGVDFFKYVLDFPFGTVDFIIWDLAGQSQFLSVIDLFLLGVKGFILAYDCTAIESYFALHSHWIPLLKEKKLDNIPILIISTKNDLKDKIEVQPDIVQEFIANKEEHNLNIIGFLETSVKNSLNINETLSILAKSIIDQEISRVKK